MEPTRSDRILDEWSRVASSATPPGAPPRSVAVTRAGPGVSLAGAGLLVVAVIAAVAWLGRPTDPTGTGGQPTASPTPTATAATPSPTEAATPTPSPTPSPTPAPTPTPPILATCDTGNLVARITMWEGAAGSRIADVQLTNTGPDTCTTSDTWQVSLVDGNDTVLIAGAPPSASSDMVLPSGQVVTTLVRASNYCGPEPAAPVTLSFNVDAGQPLRADPESPDDTTTPPCNGPGEPGSIEMQPWQS